MAKKQKFIQVENKNALIELLKANEPFEKIYVANNAYRDDKTKAIINEASSRNIPVEKVSRKRINRLSKSRSCESVIGYKPTTNIYSLNEALDHILEKKDNIFVLILDHIKYSQNVGALVRSAFGAGVDLVILDKRESHLLTEEVTRISMGASERVPIVHSNLFHAIKELKDFGIKVVGVHMDGRDYTTSDLSGNIAFVVGAEDTGISTRIIDRCDELIKIPMQDGIGSLNVSAAGSVLMFEKKRQDNVKSD